MLETGWYCFHFRSSVDFVSGAVQLRYSPHTYQNVEEAKESEPIVWNEEHIEDFVRKLGFLDTDGDSASQIRLFLHHNQVCGWMSGALLVQGVVYCLVSYIIGYVHACNSAQLDNSSSYGVTEVWCTCSFLTCMVFVVYICVC